MSLLSRLQQNPVVEQQNPGQAAPAKEVGGQRFQDVVYGIHREAIKDLGFEEHDVRDDQAYKEIEEEIRRLADAYLDKQAAHYTRADRDEIVKEVLDEAFGYGPITPLLHDNDISEVMINGPKQIYVERRGKLQLTKVCFRDDAHLNTVIERILAPLGRRVDESMPYVDARLPDGSRVNAIIPPLALNGGVVTIRKFSSQLLGINDLIKTGTLTANMAKFIEACVKGRLNIIVSGGTGAGKTSTLNIISSFIPDDERIVTIEDSAELDLKQEHVISLETRPPNIDRKGEVTIRDLVRNSLRMRPDRLVVGEVRGGEALDMLQAMNTGHDGSLTTGHSNSPRDTISRLETMVLMAGMELPVKAIREQIASAINIIVHQSRLQDGTRKITHMTEVTGMEGEVITLQDIFIFERTGVDEHKRVLGRHRATGITPKCVERLAATGITFPPNFFSPNQ
ncbi:MAG: CpaF family protein [Syntrophomonadaceae bacterium]